MGEVWLAEQTTPVRRQALALMDHPAIATVYDGGSTPKGRPYFAMEYVKGEPITTYCDRQRLTTQARLELFMQVCEGVQHAHQKGVIHRDLKPSNVLVTILDDHPVPKIIDFGVAKATAQHLTEHTLFTELGVMIGTPEYMSPEQAEMGGLDPGRGKPPHGTPPARQPTPRRPRLGDDESVGEGDRSPRRQRSRGVIGREAWPHGCNSSRMAGPTGPR
jgi:serine/threonine protein kinase